MKPSRAAIEMSLVGLSQVNRFNFDGVICPLGKCTIIENGMLRYFDTTHLNPLALGGIADELDDPLLPPYRWLVDAEPSDN